MNAFDNGEFQKYSAEAKENWGKTDAYREHAERTRNYSRQKWNALAQEMDHIMADFALSMNRGDTPGSAAAQSLVSQLQNHITGNYYLCTKEILAGLGQMYVTDQRFTKNMDRHADGTARYVSAAIAVYCGK